MVGLARKGEKELECPFCSIGKIKSFYKEGYKQAHTSRISGRQATRSFQRPETYEILEDCPNCGAKRKDIQNFFEGKYKKKMSHEERIEMLKKRGLPLVLGSKN
jgi:rubredoxin